MRAKNCLFENSTLYIKNYLESDIQIFADDTTLLTFGANAQETTDALNRDLIKISNWATVWKGKFGADKSREVLFTQKPGPDSPPLKFNAELMKQVTVHKHLGVILTNTLDWGPHVQFTIMKANRKMRFYEEFIIYKEKH